MFYFIYVKTIEEWSIRKMISNEWLYHIFTLKLIIILVSIYFSILIIWSLIKNHKYMWSVSWRGPYLMNAFIYKVNFISPNFLDDYLFIVKQIISLFIKQIIFAKRLSLLWWINIWVWTGTQDQVDEKSTASRAGFACLVGALPWTHLTHWFILRMSELTN